MLVSNFFHLEEFNTTQHREVDNTIPEDVYPTVLVCAKEMDRVRELLDAPCIVSSWYRSQELERAIKNKPQSWVSYSQHTRGEAVDFICPGFGSPADVAEKIAAHAHIIHFDQLIYELTWVHISFALNPARVARKQVLTYTKDKRYISGIVRS